MATEARAEIDCLTVDVGAARVPLFVKGDGPPVVVLHHDVGTPSWLAFYDALAVDHRVIVPHHPGYGASERPEWLRSVPRLAALHKWVLSAAGVPGARLVGLGFGAWIAAEMAITSRGGCPGLVLVNPMGLRPDEGEILDQFLIGLEDYVRAGFATPAGFEAVFGEEPELDQLLEWEINREMTTRLAWSPYMFDHELPDLLGAIDAPTLVVHASEDRVVPASCARRYAARIPGARLRIVAGAGHLAEMERPDEVGRLVREFFAGAA